MTIVDAAARAALAMGRSEELMLIAKVTLLLGAGLLAAHGLRRAQASARHLVLASTFAAVLVVPFASRVAPRVAVGLPVAEAPQSIGSVATAPMVAAMTRANRAADVDVAVAAAAMQTSLATILRMVWFVGSCIVLGSLFSGVRSLRRLRRHGIPVPRLQQLATSIARDLRVNRPVHLLTHERIAAPLTFGIRQPVVFLPLDIDTWTDVEIERALTHEIEHVRRFDWGLHVMTRAACAMFWFHPLVWVAERRLRLEAERACDDAVIRGVDTTEYAEQLVSLARRFSAARDAATVGMASRSDLSVRVAALLDPRQKRGRFSPVLSVTVAAAVAVLSTAVSAVHFVEAASDDAADDLSLAEFLQPSRGERALYRAALRGDVQRMTELIDGGANVNRAFDGDGTPLIGAAREGKLAAARLLLDRGADANLAVAGDGNPLIMAAREGHIAIVELLLDRGARIDQIVPEDENALIQASASGHLDVVKLLLSRGADVNSRAWTEAAFERPNGEWRTALSMARRGRHAEVVKVLLAAGARE
jgi:beta-lactamase regulating signal transducer with metallopeptidase domain